MQILNIAGYQFAPLSHLDRLQRELLSRCGELELKGTILLSTEGLNISLAGAEPAIRTLQSSLPVRDMVFHETYSRTLPFKRLKVKIKKEIITLRKDTIDPVAERAPAISPALFKQWLDEHRDITILDTRNDYEIQFGTFAGAMNLHLNDFCEFPEAAASVTPDKPIVMFCTGGIRCEKAALYLLDKGYPEVYQLHGGILGYFSHVGGAHYQGDCFVFDERIALDHHLQPTGLSQCIHCNGPVADSSHACPR